MYVYAYLFNLHIYLTILLTSGASNPEKGEIVDHNPDQDFRCNDGHYVARIFVCDGIPDCDDNSDETRDQCRNISCNDQTFQCGYGACISKEYVCDGLKQCIDGSDETAQACKTSLIRKSNRNKRADGDSCPKPPPSLDKVISFNCDRTSSKSCGTRNGYVPDLTIATIKCKPNYYPEKESSPSFCYNNKWQPPFDSCFKKCEKLNPVNVDMKCNRNGVNIPCDENSLLAGSKVRPVCKELHKYGDFVPGYREITCKGNGKWDKTLFSCIPECGRPYTNPNKLIQGGVEESISDSPWHVAIYNAKKVLICGGTIISPYIVLSAAHCFEEDNKPTTNTANYEVVASKVSRNYSITDNRNQKVFKIKEIRFAGKGYFGNTNYNTADIVALILKEKLNISATVLPACIDWTGSGTITHPEEDTLGKVSGWGRIEYEGKYSENLTTVNLPFISRQRCYNIVLDDFKPFITLDKFCAGKEGRAGVLQGDSGGGFLLRDGPFYYLRGIVSLKQASNSSVAAFTDLTDHIDWILRLRDEVNNIMSPSEKNPLETFGERICEDYDVNNCMKTEDCLMADHLIITRRAIFCGYDADDTEKICCSLPNSTQSFSSSKPGNQTELNNDSKSSRNSTSANETTQQRLTKGITRLASGFDEVLSKRSPNENVICSSTTEPVKNIRCNFTGLYERNRNRIEYTN
ncbi:modular serine protease-like [Planococcus citri]|uniref:modular serine protease-like n=1 Tax=Planococcus citri TaxID=170843 RepID=UPI0031F7E94A